MSKLYKYAGIGSRETPVPILSIMRKYALAVAFTHILRSGGASGADDSFYQGAKLGCKLKGLKPESRIEIFLPWDGFNGFKKEKHSFCHPEPSLAASIIAQKYHPNYDRLKNPAKLLMARNSMQVLGRLLTNPVDFVVCYTSDGKDSGGTGQAIRIAEDRNIPIYNLFFKESYEFCMDAINDFNNNEKEKWESAYEESKNG
jgi:hypothetical protein